MANGRSIRKACLEWGVLRGTLQERINGRVLRKEASEPSQRLLTVQEQRLMDWVLVQEALGRSPTYAQIRGLTRRILIARRDALPLRKRQIAGFIRRNPILKTKRQLRIDSVRVNGAKSEIIKPQFQKLEVPSVKAIKPENRWNINEASIIEG